MASRRSNANSWERPRLAQRPTRLDAVLRETADYVATNSGAVKVESAKVDEGDLAKGIVIKVEMPQAMADALKDLSAKALNALGEMSLGRQMVGDQSSYRIEKRKDSDGNWHCEPSEKLILYPDPPIYYLRVDFKEGMVKPAGTLDEESLRRFSTLMLFRSVLHELTHAAMAEIGTMPKDKADARSVPGTFSEGVPTYISSVVEERVRGMLGLGWMSMTNDVDAHDTVVREVSELTRSPGAKCGEMAAVQKLGGDAPAAYIMGSVLPSIDSKYSGYFEQRYHNGDFLCYSVHVGTGGNLQEAARLIMGANGIKELSALALSGLRMASEAATPLRRDAQDAPGGFAESIMVAFYNASVGAVNGCMQTEEKGGRPHIISRATMAEAVCMLSGADSKDALLLKFDDALKHTYSQGGLWLSAIYELRQQHSLRQPRQVYVGD